MDVGGWGLGPKGSLGFRVLWSAGIEGFLGSSSGLRDFWFGGSRIMIKAQTQRYQTLSSTLATDALRLRRKNSLPGPGLRAYPFMAYTCSSDTCKFQAPVLKNTLQSIGLGAEDVKTVNAPSRLWRDIGNMSWGLRRKPNCVLLWLEYQSNPKPEILNLDLGFSLREPGRDFGLIRRSKTFILNLLD